jgi:hypothetical protein
MAVLSASQLRMFSMTNPPQCVLPRSECVEYKYQNFRSNSDKLTNYVDKVNEMIGKHQYYFCENDFPYATEKGIKHMLCWFTTKTSKGFIIEEMRKKYDVITCWQNLPENRSVSSIEHIHVFIRV